MYNEIFGIDVIERQSVNIGSLDSLNYAVPLSDNAVVNNAIIWSFNTPIIGWVNNGYMYIYSLIYTEKTSIHMIMTGNVI